MKIKALYFLLIFLLIVKDIPAQYFLLDVGSATEDLALIHKLKMPESIPGFVVGAELEGWMKVDNDQLAKPASKMPTLKYFDENGVEIFSRAITQATIPELNSSLELNGLPKNPDEKDYVYFDQKIIVYNSSVGTAELKDRATEHSKKISVRSIPEGSLSTLFSENDLKIIADHDMNIRTFYPSRFASFQADSSGEMYFFGRLNFLDKDTNKVLQFRYFIARFNKEGDFVNVYPVETSEKKLIFADRFLIKDSSRFFAITLDYSWKKKEDALQHGAIYFLENFSLQEGTFVAEGKSPYPMPKIYTDKYFFNCLSMFSARYPILSLPFSNELVHLENYKTNYLIGQDLFLQNVNWTDPTCGDNDPIAVLYTSRISEGKYAIFYHNKAELKPWQMIVLDDSMKILERVDFSWVGEFLNPYYVDLDNYTGMLTFYELLPGRKLSLPFHFFGNRKGELVDPN